MPEDTRKPASISDRECPDREVPELLPALRMDLDFQPSPSEEQPGLLIRDSFRFSDTTLIIPPFLLRFLPFFDGRHSRQQLIDEVQRVANQDDALRLEKHLRETLEDAGFLKGARFDAMRNQALRAFEQMSVRPSSHAGAAYPAEEPVLRSYLDTNLLARRNGHKQSPNPLLALAAPHISFEGGWESYASMVSALEGVDPDSLFVVMGTSHYGKPNRIGLTRKRFHTPFGFTVAESELVESLASSHPEVFTSEDYCHAIDHSVEFHVLLLQYALRPEIRVLPLLVGPYLESMASGGTPDDSTPLQEAFECLRKRVEEQNRNVVWLLSVDMAHMGKRYGDNFEAIAQTGRMVEVEKLDRARVGMLSEGDGYAFWQDVNARDAELKWCGSSTLFTFSRLYPEARAEMLSYQQWNIDPQSVVSFGTLAFHR